MVKINKDSLVKMSVQGNISPPKTGPYRINTHGYASTLPGVGGITYNVKVGSSAMGWVADHVEPGVSIKVKDEQDNSGLQTFACVGNEAVVISGSAKGRKGVVIGKHGGIEHVIVQFDDDTLDKLAIDDKIAIKAFGTGLKLTDHPDISIKNLDPDLLEKLPIKETSEGIEVPVTTKIPAHLMGSGIGAPTTHRGDYDITTHDPEAYEKYNLKDLKLGDLVLLEDSDNEFGREYLKGARSIGVVIHSDCVVTGHGPGVTTLLTSKKPVIEGSFDDKANIANYLDLEKLEEENKQQDQDKDK
ncbi:DUF4438 domain-containing protein [Natranaerobius thermophilus]|uniref:DUF4438 domain-containing protein n=1 Tax=Natranaerobius thermophilus (strain ATCC BAA-1301 / DSM 18059 / JW/NM-WN-LF) TaxID=457570 RepID=B2A8J2_NATTJ|nr:DUF4438 domain-containing protein [Natranaerobius thermophilus]ACB85876.1 conserved hypothetical protein [Natranaerobius thermophilus JW/NM-WN-LF]